MYGAMTVLLQMLDSHQAAGLEVISWGCPVPFFGHLESAQLATVGINPSNREFVGTDGSELAGGDRRLAGPGVLAAGRRGRVAVHLAGVPGVFRAEPIRRLVRVSAADHRADGTLVLRPPLGRL